MAKHDLPRRGSAAANGLLTLFAALAGRATISSWITVIGWKGSRAQFVQNVVERLQRAGLIRVTDDAVEILPAGRGFLGEKDEQSDLPPAVPVAPSYRAPMRPLNIAKHFPPRPLRPEGFEFRSHPSLMGGQRIEYRTGAVAADA